MRSTSVLLVVSCWLSPVLGQWLETTIQLPDSSYPVALCYNSVSNQIYCANQQTATVSIIDGASNQLVGTVPVGPQPIALCHNPHDNKVYCGDWDGVTVIDSSGDTVTVPPPVGSETQAVCYGGGGNKAYSGGSNTVAVIDGAGDTVLAALSAIRTDGLLYNPRNACVYVGDRMDPPVMVIDGSGDSVAALVPTFGEVLCCNESDNKVYCTGEWCGWATVIDGATNQVVDSVPVGAGPRALCYNACDNKVYCANAGSGDVTVFDGATNEVIATVVTGACPLALCYDAQNDKVYCANALSDDVTIIDGSTNNVLQTIAVGGGPRAFAFNPVQNRVYVANHHGSSVSVIRDSGGGIGETPGRESRTASSPTIARGVLFLPQSLTPAPYPLVLVSAAGRRVLDLRPGPNDVSALSPGVYFLHSTMSHRTAPVGQNDIRQSQLTKVVLTR